MTGVEHWKYNFILYSFNYKLLFYDKLMENQVVLIFGKNFSQEN